MGAIQFIRIQEFCANHGIDESFVFDLQEYEIIQIKQVGNEPHISELELPILEKMTRLHQGLEINPEGLQAIYHLLEKVNGLQQEVNSLRIRLRRFEE